MIRALKKINRQLDHWLFQRGFHLAPVRLFFRIQFWLATVVPLLLLGVDSSWARDFWAGAWLAIINFYFLARLAQQLLFIRKGATVALLVSFYGRLLLTALVLAGLIVWLRASVVALLFGLSTVVMSIALWGGMCFFRKNSRRHRYGC